MFQRCERHKLNSVDLLCVGVEAEILQTFISKPGHINTKSARLTQSKEMKCVRGEQNWACCLLVTLVGMSVCVCVCDGWTVNTVQSLVLVTETRSERQQRDKS